MTEGAEQANAKKAQKRTAVLIEIMWTLDNIAFMLQIPVERIDTQIRFRNFNRPFRKARGDRRMDAIRLEDIDGYPTWRVPNSSFLRYCQMMDIDVDTMVVTPTQQIQNLRETEEPQ